MWDFFSKYSVNVSVICITQYVFCCCVCHHLKTYHGKKILENVYWSLQLKNDLFDLFDFPDISSDTASVTSHSRWCIDFIYLIPWHILLTLLVLRATPVGRALVVVEEGVGLRPNVDSGMCKTFRILSLCNSFWGQMVCQLPH